MAVLRRAKGTDPPLFVGNPCVLPVVLENGLGDRLSARRVRGIKNASVRHPIGADEQGIDFPNDMRRISPAISCTHRNLGDTATSAQDGKHGKSTGYPLH